jgi:hypothetical protein
MFIGCLKKISNKERLNSMNKDQLASVVAAEVGLSQSDAKKSCRGRV